MADLPPDVNIGSRVLISACSEASIAIVFVALRIYTQAKVVGRVELDDYLMITALVSAVLNTSLITHAVSWGIGRHIFYLAPDHIVNVIKFEFITQVRHLSLLGATKLISWTPGIVAPILARISFALYLLKFVGTSEPRRWTLWSVIIVQALYNTIQIILIFCQCEKFAALWDPSVGGKCWSRKMQVDTGYLQGALNCVHDLILTFLPIAILKDLNMTIRIKVILSVLMGVSIFAFAASIVKTIMLGNLAKVEDFTYLTVDFIMWFTIENYVVTIAASIPALRPSAMHVKKQVSTNASDTYAMNNYAKSGSRGTKGYVPYGEGRDGTLKSYNHSTTIGNGVSTKLPDSESGEYILPIQKDQGGITKTTNVSVMYTEKERRDLEKGMAGSTQ